MALKAVLKAELLSEKIVPILEPVKDSAALKSTLKELVTFQHPFYFIPEPKVGSYGQFATKMQDLTASLSSPYCQLAAYHEEQTALCLAGEPELKVTPTPFASNPHEIFLQDAMHFYRHDEEVVTDEFFSDAHLYFATDGFVGFSDYGISGAQYVEKGYPQKRLSFHVVYLDYFGSLRIKHFASTSNDDFQHLPEKFLEAGEQFMAWVDRYQEATYISPFLKELYQLVEQKHFPGMGVLKKLTMAHQLATMSFYFQQDTKKIIHRY